jgi:hypothetical protein
MRHSGLMKWISGALGALTLAMAPLAVAMTVVRPAGATTASTQSWMAHSAYGLQVSVPKSWKVGYFQNCPESAPGTLLIGMPLLLMNCANYLANKNTVVDMQPAKSDGQFNIKGNKRFVLHGLHIESLAGGRLSWYVPSDNTIVTASGPQAGAVLKTLTKATSKAQAAPGMIKGTENVQGPTTAPVTGLVAAIEFDAHGPEMQIHAYDGEYSDLLPPGKYNLTGHDGDAPCPIVTVTVRSGRTTYTPPIVCQGI